MEEAIMKEPGGEMMGTILKYILKNIWEKKFRTFLIVIAITSSAALFFASNAIAGTMTVMYENQMRMQTGQASLLIRADDQSPSRMFRIAADAVEGVALTAGEVSMGGHTLCHGMAAKVFIQKQHSYRFEGSGWMTWMCSTLLTFSKKL